MKICKFFLNIKKEEKWINDTCKKGYRFVGRSLFDYKFEKNNTHKTYHYYIDQRNFCKNNHEFINFLEELNYHFVVKSFGFYYFEAEEKADNKSIYTDSNSRICFYLRNILFLILIAILNISIIQRAHGPYLFNLSIPKIVNTIILIMIIVIIMEYIKTIFIEYKSH